MDKEYVNPAGVFKHPAYTGVVTVTDPRRFHFIAGRCAADPDDYTCTAPGDFVGQYRQVMETLAIELKAVGATWNDVVFRRIFTLDVDAFLRQPRILSSPSTGIPRRCRRARSSASRVFPTLSFSSRSTCSP